MEGELGGQSLHVPANGLTSRGKATMIIFSTVMNSIRWRDIRLNVRSHIVITMLTVSISIAS
jgi:hypothetical protein